MAAERQIAKVWRVTGTSPMGMLMMEHTAISAVNIAVKTRSLTAVRYFAVMGICPTYYPSLLLIC